MFLKRNIRYRITKIVGKEIRLRNISNEKDVITFAEEAVDDIFIYSYCATCHSSLGGSSIKETMTIHEWDLNYVSRERLYTAITRCVDFKKVKFFTVGAKILIK